MTYPGEPEVVSIPLPDELKEQFEAAEDFDTQLRMLLDNPDHAGNLVELMTEEQIDALLADYDVNETKSEVLLEVREGVTEDVGVQVEGLEEAVLVPAVMKASFSNDLAYKKARVLRIVYLATQASD